MDVRDEFRDDEPRSDDALLSGALRAYLSRLLHDRPLDTSAAAALAPDGLDADRALDDLEKLGHLARHAEEISILPPENAVVDRARVVLRREAASITALIDTLESLPELSRRWALGIDREHRRLEGEVVVGAARIRRHWNDLSMRFAMRRPCIVVPSLLEAFDERDYPDGHTGRYLVSAENASEASRDTAERLVALGATVRTREALPAWLFLEPDSVCSIGFVGERGAFPEIATTVYDERVIRGFRLLFDEWWRTSTPLSAGREPWRSVLALLAEDRSDEQIAAQLGIGVRTVRRRIAEAMDELGAENRFQLGAAWARLEGER